MDDMVECEPIELPGGQVDCTGCLLKLDDGTLMCIRCALKFMKQSDLDSEDGSSHSGSDAGSDAGSHDGSQDGFHAGSKSLTFDKNDDFSNPRRGTGRVHATLFTPHASSPSATPLELFKGVRGYGGLRRYVHRRDHGIGLIFTDGACIGNGQPEPRAGWAFNCGPPDLSTGQYGNALALCRLENQGPYGDKGLQTSNRAELRAVIGALEYRAWDGEGFHTLVIATDSEYVVKGSTQWIKRWLENGWKTSKGEPVKNKDLWLRLLGLLEEFNPVPRPSAQWRRKLAVQFWWISRDLNSTADRAAKEAAARPEPHEKHVKILGLVE